MAFRIARAGCGALGMTSRDPPKIVWRQMHVHGANILFEIGLRRFVPGIGTMSLPCARTQARANCEALQPFSLASSSTRLYQIQIRLEVLALEARRSAPIIVRRQILEFLDLPGEKAAPERAVSHETDPQLRGK